MQSNSNQGAAACLRRYIQAELQCYGTLPGQISEIYKIIEKDDVDKDAIRKLLTETRVSMLRDFRAVSYRMQNPLEEEAKRVGELVAEIRQIVIESRGPDQEALNFVDSTNFTHPQCFFSFFAGKKFNHTLFKYRDANDSLETLESLKFQFHGRRAL